MLKNMAIFKNLCKVSVLLLAASSLTVSLLYFSYDNTMMIQNMIQDMPTTTNLSRVPAFLCACTNTADNTTTTHIENCERHNDTKMTSTENREFLVPNLVHYIWYMDKSIKFRFDKALAIISAAKNLQPDAIYFHTNNPPHGKYFDMLKNMAIFKIVKREPPRSVFKDVLYETTYANYDRVKILLEYGGIYLDFDVMVIQSFDDLRKYRCTMGEEMVGRLCAGIVICAKNEPFLHIWLNSYYDDFRTQWAYNSGLVSTKLATRYPDLIHIEPTRLHNPNWVHLDQIWGKKKYPWRKNYAIHTWIRLAKFKEYPSETSIKTSNTTYGEIARWVYYET